MSMLLAPFALIIFNLGFVVLLMVLSLRGFPMRFGILIEILLLVVLHKVSSHPVRILASPLLEHILQ